MATTMDKMIRSAYLVTCTFDFEHVEYLSKIWVLNDYYFYFLN
jgi:hypothetical protein